MNVNTLRFLLLLIFSLGYQYGSSEDKEPVLYGDFENWVTRNIRESVVIGGHTRTLYEVGPDIEINGNIPYSNLGDSPWASSNVYSRISRVTKASNTVFPHVRSHGNLCAKLCTKLENIKVLGTIDIKYLVAGALFLGEVIEPLTDLNDPYSKINMGMPYTKKPKYLTLDYMLDVPFTESRIRATGFGQHQELDGRDNAMIFILLQRRWEDEEGNIHATRIGTGGQILKDGTDWLNDHKIEIKYGDCSDIPGMEWLGLRNGENSYYAYNSKHQLVRIIEENWDTEESDPTHVIIMIRSSDDVMHTGSEGTAFYVDNISFEF